MVDIIIGHKIYLQYNQYGNIFHYRETLTGRHTCMCCLSLTNVQHTKKFFVCDNLQSFCVCSSGSKIAEHIG